MAQAEPLSWVDCGDLLRATEARQLSRSGDELTFACFSGNHLHGDSHPSAGMNARTSLWRCRNPSCGLKGNAVDYLVALRGLNRTEALRVLEERYGGPQRAAEEGGLAAEVRRILGSHDEPEEPRAMISHDEYVARFGLDWLCAAPEDFVGPMGYMIGRGFAPEVLQRWGIGYDSISDRVTVPVYDASHVLVGIKGRAWREDALRYCVIGDALRAYPRYGFNTYMKSRHVFGIDRAREDRRVVVVEGELNAVALNQMGVDAVAVAGAEFSDAQRDLIVGRFSEVVVYFDDDPAGHAGARKVASELHPYMSVYLVEGPGDAADALHPDVKFSSGDVSDLLCTARSYLQSMIRTMV